MLMILKQAGCTCYTLLHLAYPLDSRAKRKMQDLLVQEACW